MFKKILVPVDLTDVHQPALDIAARLAKENDGEVTLLHVVEVISEVGPRKTGISTPVSNRRPATTSCGLATILKSAWCPDGRRLSSATRPGDRALCWGDRGRSDRAEIAPD